MGWAYLHILNGSYLENNIRKIICKKRFKLKLKDGLGKHILQSQRWKPEDKHSVNMTGKLSYYIELKRSNSHI